MHTLAQSFAEMAYYKTRSGKATKALTLSIISMFTDLDHLYGIKIKVWQDKYWMKSSH